MGFSLPWMHGYDPSTATVEGTALAYDDAHHTRAGERLITKLRKPRIVAIAEALVLQLQEIETSALWPMLVETWVDRTIGADLRSVATLVGLRGFGDYDDNTLRRMVRARIRVNRSNGTIPTLIAIYRAFVGSAEVQVRRYPNAIVHVYGRDPLSDETREGIELARFLRAAALGGVYIVTDFPVAPWAETFRFAEDIDADSEEASSGFGWDGADAPGGAFAVGFTGEV